MPVLFALLVCGLGANACGGSSNALDVAASASGTAARTTPQPSVAAARPVTTSATAVVRYRAGAAAPHIVIALAGNKTLAVDTGTGEVRELITAPDTVAPYYVPYQFTPSTDGVLLAYTCTSDGSAAEGQDKRDLCIWGYDGASVPPVVRIEDLMAGEVLSPASWSPDGRRLVFRDQLLVGPPLPPVWTFVFNFETSRSTRAFRGMDVASAQWSPDGSRLAAANAAGVFVARADSGDAINIAASVMPPGANETFGNISWSPDSTSVAFTAADAGHFNEKLYVASADGIGVREVGAGGTGVAWSPDGRWIARAVDPRVLGETGCVNFPCRQLWAARADGSEDRKLAEGFGDAEGPSWAPNSQHVAFLGSTTTDSMTRGYFGLFIARIDAGTPQLASGDLVLTGSPSITWSADGKRTFFTAYTKLGAGGACGRGGCADGYLFMVDSAAAEAPRQLYDGPVHAIIGR